MAGPSPAVGPSPTAQDTVDGVVYVADQSDVNAGATVTDYVGTDTGVAIPASVTIDGVTYAVTSVGYQAFYGVTAPVKLTSVALPDSVTSIAAQAFESNLLTSIDLGDGPRTIGDLAFRDNRLASVILPDTVRTIGRSAFRNNQISSLDLGTSVRSIDNDAFAENDLTSVVLPNSVSEIGGSAFFNNDVARVQFGNAVRSIGRFAFSNSALVSLVLPASVTSIGEEAFSNNHGLRRVRFRGPAPSTFTPKGPSGSLGNENDPVVLYDPEFAEAEATNRFTRPRWQGYRSSPAWFIIDFEVGGHGVAPGRTRVPYGGLMDRPSDPSAPDWTFDGWYTDARRTVSYDFTRVVTHDLNLHARWIEEPTRTEPSDPGTPTGEPSSPPSPEDPTEQPSPEVTSQPTQETEGIQPPPAPAEAPAAAAVPDGRAPVGPEPAAPSAPEPDRSRPTGPSAVTDALPSLRDLLDDPTRVVRAFSSGFVLTVIVFLTASVVNRLLERRALAWGAWLGTKPALGAAVQRTAAWVERSPMRSAVVFTGISGGTLAAVDPGFGWDVVSLRLVASAVAAVLVGLVGCVWLVGRIATRRFDIEVVIHGIPTGVLLAAAGVLASRLLDFQPGFLVGAIIGLAVAGGEPQAAQVEKVRATLALSIAASAWLGTGLIAPDSPVSAFVHDALVVMVTALLCGLLLRLLPAPAFPGAVLLRHARNAWVVLFALTVAAFLTIVLPQPSSWLYVGDQVARWLLLAGLFAALAVSLYVLELREARRARTHYDVRGTGSTPSFTTTPRKDR